MTDAVDAPTPVDLSRTQELIWAAQRLHPDAPLSNMANRFRLHGAVDPDRLVSAFHRVVEECDVLRLTIGRSSGARTRAVVHDAPPSTTDVIDLPLEDLERWTAGRISVPIRADRSMYESVLIRHDTDDWTWWLNLHHVATDAWSSALIFAATSAAYERMDRAGDVGSRRADAEIDLTDVIDGRFFASATGRQRSDAAGSAASSVPAVVDAVPLTPYGERQAETTGLERNAVPLGPDTWRALDAVLDGEYRSLNLF